MYKKAHLISDFRKKNISSAGARTHEMRQKVSLCLIKFSERDRKVKLVLIDFSHIDKSSMEAGKTAAWSEDNKFTPYGNALRDDYHFFPIAVKTFGT